MSINRGNAPAEAFHQAEDYEAFFKRMQDANNRLAKCLSPSQFRLVPK